MTRSTACPNCGRVSARERAMPREVAAQDGTALTYQDLVTSCSSCGERWYTHEQALEAGRARAGALRHHEGLLTPAEIRRFRERHGLSQSGLEALLGTGPKTVVRWEKGTVCQSRAADRLLRLLIHDAGNVEFLARLGTPAPGVRVGR